MKKKLNELFSNLQQIVEIEEMGYHKLEDDRLKPVHKVATDNLSIEEWKQAHREDPVYVDQVKLLTEIVESKEPVAIANVNQDQRSPEEFKQFGIKSVLIFPVVYKNITKGLVVIPSINSFYDFTETEVNKCQRLVEKYSKFLV